MATEPNLQTFINDFVCQANTNGTKYFFFEVFFSMHPCEGALISPQFFDEKWKDLKYGGVEGHWGLFYQK